MGQAAYLCKAEVSSDVVAVVRPVCNDGTPLEVKDNASRNLLLASKAGDIVGMNKAIKAGADINTRLPLQNCLHDPDDSDHEQAKVTEPTDCVNTETETQGCTPLMHAAWEGHIEAVKLLLSLGAIPDLQDANGMQALHLAAQSASAECFHLLLQAGANPLAKDDFGRDALQCVPLVTISRNSAHRRWLTLLKEASGMAVLVSTLLLADEQEFQSEVGTIASGATVVEDDEAKATSEIQETQSNAWSISVEEHWHIGE